eukprot:15469478-Alexandrium_andersonii.AAC.1
MCSTPAGRIDAGTCALCVVILILSAVMRPPSQRLRSAASAATWHTLLHVVSDHGSNRCGSLR